MLNYDVIFIRSVHNYIIISHPHRGGRHGEYYNDIIFTASLHSYIIISHPTVEAVMVNLIIMILYL